MNMKRFLLLFAVMFSAASMSAQKYFVCTGNNVTVRTGPGKNYKVIRGWGRAVVPGQDKIKLGYGELVYNEGVRRNGYIKVSSSSMSVIWENGWIPAILLKPAKMCSQCKGKGKTGRICPECQGEGRYICCYGTGMELCIECGGLGYY